MNQFCGIVVVLLAASAAAAGDWREDILEAGGYGTTPADLRKAVAGRKADPDKLTKAYRQLGSESFPERQRAQQVILSAGSESLAWLRQQEPTDNPEILLRVQAIRRTLELSSDDRRDRMFLHAASSLLQEINGDRDPATGGVFYEWFGTPARDLGDRYRAFHRVAPAALKSRVRERTLFHEGELAGGADQRLVLRSEDWPGAEVFPDKFTITTRLGGTPGGGGTWHLGVSVGRVRALFHPEYGGGGFRFERIDDNDRLTLNKSMDFTPATDKLQLMKVSVTRLDDEGVRLSVTVTQKGSEPYQQAIEIPAETIGPLTEISLDRSGRSGGDARFSELMIELEGD